jgi:hypothetical protein
MRKRMLHSSHLYLPCRWPCNDISRRCSPCWVWWWYQGNIRRRPCPLWPRSPSTAYSYRRADLVPKARHEPPSHLALKWSQICLRWIQAALVSRALYEGVQWVGRITPVQEGH